MIDWTALGTIISLLAVGLAIVALALETRQSRTALQTDALLRLSEKFDSDRFRTLRRMAAYRLLLDDETKAEQNYALDEVLEFFSEVAFLKKKKALDDELVFDQFSWWIVRYWICAEEHIQKVRCQDPLSWHRLEKFVNSLKSREKKEGYTDESYSAEMLQQFLHDESSLIVIDQDMAQHFYEHFQEKKTH